jgi:hypothetical protein
MMSAQSVAIAPPHDEDFPPKEVFDRHLMPLENGCLLWLGPYHQRTGPFVKYKGKQYQVHRALFYYENGSCPKQKLIRKCEPKGCVAPAHRALSLCA